MINTILIKRRLNENGAQGGAPASLSGGELAFNEVNNVLYYGHQDGVIPIAGPGHFATVANLELTATNLNDKIDSQVTTLNTRITTEVGTLNTTIQNVSGALDQRITDEIAAVVDAAPEALNTLKELASALDNDASFASNLVNTLNGVNTTIQTVSSGLQDQIDNLNTDSSANLAALSAELKGDISVEATARIEGDNQLRSSLQSVSASLDSSISTLRTDVVATSGALDSKIDSVSSALRSDLTTETARASAAEAGLHSEMVSVSGSLDSKIDSVSGALRSDLTTETARATAQELVLANSIFDLRTEVVTASSSLKSQIEFITSNIDPAAIDSLTEIVGAFQSADSTLNGAITALALAATNSLATASAALSSAIEDEKTRAMGAESAIADDLSSETDRAVLAEGNLLAAINALSGVVANNATTAAADLSAANSALDTRVTDIENNYLDKRVGGIVTGDVGVQGLSATSLEVGTAASTTLFVGDGVVGINTEAPSEALHVVGNGLFTGNLLGMGTSVLSGFVIDGGSF